MEQLPKTDNLLKIYSHSGHTKSIVNNIVSLSEQICRNVALHHQ